MKCSQCNKQMNPVEALLGPVCGKCARVNHPRITRQGVFRVFGDLENEDVEENPSHKEERKDGKQEQQSEEWG